MGAFGKPVNAADVMTAPSCRDKVHPWGMEISTAVSCEPPCTLAPGGRAQHTVAFRNYGPVAYEVTALADCKGLLRYGRLLSWKPQPSLCKPRMKSAEDMLQASLSLPATVDPRKLPTIEQVEIEFTRRTADGGPVERAGRLAVGLTLKG